MKSNFLPNNILTEHDTSQRESLQPLLPEAGLEPAGRRWELCPILLDGQNAGWRAVKLT